MWDNWVSGNSMPCDRCNTVWSKSLTLLFVSSKILICGRRKQAKGWFHTETLCDSCFLCFDLCSLGINHFSPSKQFSITLFVFSFVTEKQKGLACEQSLTEGNLAFRIKGKTFCSGRMRTPTSMFASPPRGHFTKKPMASHLFLQTQFNKPSPHRPNYPPPPPSLSIETPTQRLLCVWHHSAVPAGQGVLQHSSHEIRSEDVHTVGLLCIPQRAVPPTPHCLSQVIFSSRWKQGNRQRSADGGEAGFSTLIFPLE